jgi:hypothetical protein
MRGVLAVILTGLLLLGGPAAPRAQAETVDQTLRADFLKVIDRPRVPPAPSPAKLSVENGYRQELLSFASESDERVPLLILRKGERRDRQPVVIILHGTGGSKEGTRGRLEAFAYRGFLAVSMDARHHGERRISIPGLRVPYFSAMLRAYRTGQGHPYLYDTV